MIGLFQQQGAHYFLESSPLLWEEVPPPSQASVCLPGVVGGRRAREGDVIHQLGVPGRMEAWRKVWDHQVQAEVKDSLTHATDLCPQDRFEHNPQGALLSVARLTEALRRQKNSRAGRELFTQLAYILLFFYKRQKYMC